MVQTRFALILYFRMVAHKAACHTLKHALILYLRMVAHKAVKGFFEINEDMAQILLMLEVLFTQDSKVKDLFCGASSDSEPSLFFSNYFFSLGFKPIQADFQHDFARMTDEPDSSVVLVELQIALFREYNNQRLSPLGRPLSCSPVPVTDLC